MTTGYEFDARPETTQGHGPAVVTSLREHESRADLRSSDGTLLDARIALPAPAELGVGDEVLVIADARGEHYITAVLTPAIGSRRRIRLAPGRYAEVEEVAAGSIIRIFAGGEEPLFEYDAGADCMRLACEGDLDLVSRHGEINLRASRGIRLTSPTIDLAAGQRVRLAVLGVAGRAASVLGLGARGVRIEGDQNTVVSRQITSTFEESRSEGGRSTTTVDDHRITARRAEIRAETHTTRATNLFQTVERLLQVRAGRIRMLVERVFHLRSRRTTIKAQEDVSVDGRRIHLG